MAPRLDGPIGWHSFDRDTFEIGRGVTAVDNQTDIGLYDAPRAIVDTYRLRNVFGSDTAHESLRRWLRNGGQPRTVLDTAAAFPQARSAILHALEVLL